MSRTEPVFYFGAMSPYSWMAAERIGSLLSQARWEPLFLGGLFKAVGRSSWGLGERREELMRDCEQRAASYGLGQISWPEPWPTNDLHVARAMTFAASRGLLARFALTAMRAAFLGGSDLGSPEVVVGLGGELDIAPSELEAALGEPAVKDALRAGTETARARGVIGVPTVVIDGELFWGDDRLEEAVRAAGHGGRGARAPGDGAGDPADGAPSPPEGAPEPREGAGEPRETPRAG